MHEKKLLPIVQYNRCGPSCSNNDAKLPFGLVEPYAIERSGPAESIFIEPFHSVPENVHIEITYACMEDCIMCYNPTRTKVNARDKDLVWEVIRSIAESRVPHTYLIGGEPTYGYSKSELQDMVDYLTDHGSSVTIVSNGQITLKNMTSRLACYGVSIHGSDPETHDSITRTKGSFEKAIRSIREYVDEGHDVRVIPVVMGINYSQMYSLAELAFDLGAESLYYDVYEPGGIGEINSHDSTLRMAPNYIELMTAIDQIIGAHDDFPFKGSIGFGTALPYCLHPGLVERRMLANCGVGTYFGAVTSQGHFRICNQSKMNFGNVLNQPLDEIWLSDKLGEIYRSLKWVQEPCASCAVLQDCGGGCKVDEGCESGELCIDRIVRGLSRELQTSLRIEEVQHGLHCKEYPKKYRDIRCTPWLDVTEKYADNTTYWSDGDRWVKTRYQTSSITADEATVIRSIINARQMNEYEIVKAYGDTFSESELRGMVSQLIDIEGLEVE